MTGTGAGRLDTASRVSSARHRLHPFLDWPGPIPFAHRGGAGELPENTMPAFAAAVSIGYRYLETDLHLSRDGVVFAFHDDHLDRVTDRGGAIAALTAAEVETADAGFAFSPDGGATFPFRGTGVGVPRLEEILAAWPSVRVNLDPKTNAVVEPLVTLLERMNAFDRVCVGSFSDARLTRARRLSGGRLCTSMGPRAVAAVRACAWSGWMPRLGADCIQVPLRSGRVPLCDPAMVRAAHHAGLQLHVWTLDDEAAIERWLDHGVDGVMTDRPALLRAVLERRGQWYE